jgi:hypothetical protein
LSIVGPRGHDGRRVPVSFADDELVAFAGYRVAYREWKEAQRDERRVVNENRSRVAVEAAYRRTSAATMALSKAKETMHATFEAD